MLIPSHPILPDPSNGSGETQFNSHNSSLEAPYSPLPPPSPTTSIDAGLPSAPPTYEDDGLSMRTSSTHPPSYHTRRSVPDLAHHPHPLPPLPSSSTQHIPQAPPAPPTAYRGNARASQSAGTALMDDLQAVGWGGDSPSSAENQERSARPTRLREPQQRVRSERRRSRDGDVRLGGGRPGSPSPPEWDAVDEDPEGLGSTPPPSYCHDN